MADDKEKQSQYDAVYQAVTLGVMFPVAIGLGYLLGHWLDRLLGLYPWLTIIFTSMGVAAAFVNLFKTAARSDGNSTDGEH